MINALVQAALTFATFTPAACFQHVSVAAPVQRDLRRVGWTRRTPAVSSERASPPLHSTRQPTFVCSGTDGDGRGGDHDRCRCWKATTRLGFAIELGVGAGILLADGDKVLAEGEEGTVVDNLPDAKTSSAVADAPTSPATPDLAGASLRDLGFEVPYSGKSVSLNKFLGSKATLVVNPKIDDPESLHQMPGITKLATDYGNQGLNVLLFPTDQGTFEADEDRVVRIKFYQFYGFGQYPKAVVFDKVDIVGNTIHPFYRYLCRGLKNPNGIARITLNYEKFLLDKDGNVVRRYPRKLEAADFEQDVQALVADKPLPAESRDYKLSWLKADQEASKSEYAFKLGLNYYNNKS